MNFVRKTIDPTKSDNVIVPVCKELVLSLLIKLDISSTYISCFNGLQNGTIASSRYFFGQMSKISFQPWMVQTFMYCHTSPENDHMIVKYTVIFDHQVVAS